MASGTVARQDYTVQSRAEEEKVVKANENTPASPEREGEREEQPLDSVGKRRQAESDEGKIRADRS